MMDKEQLVMVPLHKMMDMDGPPYETRLRDEAALAALQGLLSGDWENTDKPEKLLECCFLMADAFMAERGERDE